MADISNRQHADDAAALQSRFVGRTVRLLQDEPTGAGFYGEEGMMADIRAITPMNDDGYKYFEVTMDFAPHSEHNLQFEKPIWFGKGNETGTATETGNVEAQVRIGLEKSDVLAYIEATDPNPVYEAWQQTGDGKPYTAWLEGIARAHLGIGEEPAEEDVPSL